MISDNLHQIQQEIRDSCALVARNPNEVTLVAVTKTVDSKKTREVIQAGVLDCAENRVEKLLEKKQELADFPEVSWHFIGNLQRRKVKRVIDEIDYFHALDSLSLAAEINKRSKKQLLCFVEVNVSGEASKQGIQPDTVIDFVKELADFDKICVIGLMTMAPFDSTETQQHDLFCQLRKLQEKVAALQIKNVPCTELSMGMSNDFKIAAKEGATFLRIGTALFNE